MTIIDDESKEEIDKKCQEILRLLEDESYFEAVEVLEMVRDTLRVIWIINKECEKDNYWNFNLKS